MIERKIRQDIEEALTGDDIGARMVTTIRRIAQLRRWLEKSELEINSQKESEMF